MYRNLEERVEAIVPVKSRPLRERLWQILQVQLADQRRAWDMQPDGQYVQRISPFDESDESTWGTHERLMHHYRSWHGC
jgi:polyphosphate kinase